MKTIGFAILTLLSFSVKAQQTLTLEECYKLADKNYPLGKQVELIRDKTGYEILEIGKGKLPKLELNAQATYQSDVIEFPFQVPNAEIEPLNKDQYRATLELNQIIYNGGRITARTALKATEMKARQKQVAVNLYQLKEKINQLFFSLLLLQEQEELLSSKQEQLKVQIKEIEAGVKFGAFLISAGDVLKAEVLKIDQQRIQVSADKIKLRENLSSLISVQLTEDVQLKKPEIITFTEGIRPELELFSLQKQQIEQSKAVLSKEVLPKIYGFALAGYGNPGLNMLENSFQDFYMVGVKANWNIFDWGKNKAAKNALSISQRMIDTEIETFQLNNDIEMLEAKKEIHKMEKMIETDKEILSLREKVLESSDSQLKNGVITTSEYVTEFNKLFEAKIDQKVHEIQLVFAQANYQIKKGY